jgi:hypothetical protein
MQIFRSTYPHNIGPNHLAELTFCDECVGKKQHWKAFLKDEELHADKLLGLVHTNVWGLAKTPSFGGERYFCIYDR